MGLVVSVTFVPGLVAGEIDPIRQKPDLIGCVLRTENIHAHETGRMIHKVRTQKKRLFNVGGHIIGDEKLT